MLIRVDTGSAVPLAEQVAAAVRRALAEGALCPGDRLPAAREVAKLLEINIHTVLRGYQQLREEGLIDLRRGRGAIVVAAPAQARLREAAAQLVAAAREAGFSQSRVVSLLRDCWKEGP
ncbi:GntR family transcriptional regulator [Streptomyces sp. Rer75]|uniref:GntR family transcriptional regulator n=1 Tax=Streptomyces sp. Rer75 TaxID=2750011 RepID=UPI0015D04AFA|nr:GntR family transcriptional regulator [Streptomyces sp. Rer75]QLH25344.1 GntR family transcriptional regulator [Streptomyces sp. Rer75]WTB09144.1 GntR family transcriptional regulator [Streptomyces antimycoticus]